MIQSDLFLKIPLPKYLTILSFYSKIRILLMRYTLIEELDLLMRGQVVQKITTELGK